MMTRGKPSLWLSTATVALMPIAALADVTPADVWSNLQAMNGALGATVSGDVSDTGSRLSVDNMSVTWILPMGVGSVGVNYGSMTLTSVGDGTVAFSTPDNQEMSFDFDIPELGSGTLSMAYSVAGYTTIASGQPGDITYDYTMDGMTLTLGDMSLEGEIASEAEGFVLEGDMVFSDMAGSYRITEGDLITITSDGEIGSGKIAMSYEAAIEGEAPVGSRSTADLGAMSSKTEISVPASGMTLMALPKALRDGLSISYDYASGPQNSTQETYLGDELIMSQITSVGANDGNFAFDDGGIQFAGSATDYALSLTQPLMMPFPIKVAMVKVDGDMQIPLLATGAADEAVIKMAMQDLTIDPELWNLFDPGAQLPRDPANMTVDMTASVKLLLDLLDFGAMAALEQSGEMPAEVESLTITGLNVQAAGAEADVVGDFTFDNTDLATFDGVPAPNGNATITLTGAEALLNTLVNMGLMSPEDLMGANMVLGGFFRPGAQPDQKVTEIVVDGATGAVSANGQRLR